MAHARLALLALALLSQACAGRIATSAKPAPSTQRPQADAERARTLAPDLYARAERAQQDAQGADDADARADHELRAELLLEAAIAEADRIESTRDAIAADERTDRLIEQRAELERQRLELAREAALARAASEARTAEDADGNVLCDRATLVLAAAITRGLDAGAAATLEGAIAQARTARTNTARVAACKRALERATQAPNGR